jgi:hypothetical protein
MLLSAGPKLKIYFYFTTRTKKVTTSGKYHNAYYGTGRTDKVYTRQCEEDTKLWKFNNVTKFLLEVGKIPKSFDFSRRIPSSRSQNVPGEHSLGVKVGISVSQPLFHGGTPKIIFRILRKHYL